jgi:hypothetical protein
LPQQAAGSGLHQCLHTDDNGIVTGTGSDCGSGGGGGVNFGTTGQIAYYPANGTAVSGETTVPITAGGTGATTAYGADANLGVAINALAYGADRTGIADSTTTITNALAASFGGCVYLPTGTYLVKNLPLTTSQCLYGDGKKLTILKAAPASTTVVTASGTGSFMALKSLGINGNSVATNCLLINSGTILSESQLLSDLEIQGCTGTQLLVQDSAEIAAHDLILHGGQYGLQITQQYGAYGPGSYDHVEAYDSSVANVLLSHVSEQTFYNLYAYNDVGTNTPHMIHVVDSHDNTFVIPHVEAVDPGQTGSDMLIEETLAATDHTVNNVIIEGQFIGDTPNLPHIEIGTVGGDAVERTVIRGGSYLDRTGAPAPNILLTNSADTNIDKCYRIRSYSDPNPVDCTVGDASPYVYQTSVLNNSLINQSASINYYRVNNTLGQMHIGVNGDGSAQMVSENNYAQVGTLTAQPTLFVYNNAEQFRIDGSGFHGNNPISVTGVTTQGLTQQIAGSTTMMFNQINAAGTTTIQTDSAGGSYLKSLAYIYLVSGTGQPIIFSPGGTEAFRIDYTGFLHGTNPASFSQLIDTGSAAISGHNCLHIDTAGIISNTGTDCGSGGGAVTSVSGDGALITNSLSSGGVTLTLGTAAAHKYWGNNTGSPAIAAFDALASGDIPNNAANTSGNAATATALASTPSLCTTGQAPTGVLANGNATGCASIGGPGTRPWLGCQPGYGNGATAVPATPTVLQSTCKNTTGSSVTITGVQCFTNNNGTSTLNVAGNTLGALLTGPITCTSSFASGTQSANVTLTNGDYLKFTFVPDGTSLQTTWVVTGTY